MKKILRKPIIIAGPCAAESQEQIQKSTVEAKKRKIYYERVSLWKPRTKPGGFDGLGYSGIPILLEVAKSGLSPATEVLSAKQCEKVIESVVTNSEQEILIWLGARNQNHQTQQEVGRVISGEPRAKLLIKNQPWPDDAHWIGIVEHVTHNNSVKDEQLLLCHRGFAPHGLNPKGYRNIPDFEAAMRVKEKTGLPMLFDPSHTGGSVELVFEMAKEASGYAFDGIIVEVHPNPEKALTDAKQQLTWKQFDEMIEIFNRKRG